jgi:hypothetical protein
MSSAIKEVTLQNKYNERQTFIITIQQTDNDFNGNPQALCQIWTKRQDGGNGNLWYPKIKGFRHRNDRTYKTQVHGGMNNTLDVFIKIFQNSMMGLL